MPDTGKTQAARVALNRRDRAATQTVAPMSAAVWTRKTPGSFLPGVL
jgi:hypothetical protein